MLPKWRQRALRSTVFFLSKNRILYSPNQGGFLRLPMLKINRLIRKRVTY